MNMSLTDLYRTTAYITLILPLNTTVLRGSILYTNSIKLVHSREVVFSSKDQNFKSLSVPHQAHQTCYNVAHTTLN
jgi:hypothetical protein